MGPYGLIAVGGLLALCLHVLIKMKDIAKDIKQADFAIVWKQYWKTDMNTFAISVVAFMIFVFCLSEWVDIRKLEKPDYTESIGDRILHFRAAATIKTLSVVWGYFSDYLIYKWIGTTKKILQSKFKDDDDKE